MSSIITGGAGFIGSHLAKALSPNNNEVHIVDPMFHGKQHMLPKTDFSNISYHKMDITIDAVPDQIFKQSNVLFHLAACKHSSNSGIDAQSILQTNIDATYRLFEQAAQKGIKTIVFTSSLYAYGRYHLPAMNESDAPMPDTVYGISKYTGELLLREICKKYGINGVILRLFFVYGPGVNPWTADFRNGYKSVIIKHFERIMQGKAPIINGDGRQSLDYIYIDDVVSALTNAPNFATTDVPIYNIASGNAISVNDLTQKICSTTAYKDTIEYNKADSTEGTVRAADISKAQNTTNWAPMVSFESGINNIYNWLNS